MLMPMCAHVHIIVSFQLIYYQIAEPPKANILQGLRKKTYNLKSKLEYISLTKLYIFYFFLENKYVGENKIQTTFANRK